MAKIKFYFNYERLYGSWCCLWIRCYSLSKPAGNPRALCLNICTQIKFYWFRFMWFCVCTPCWVYWFNSSAPKILRSRSNKSRKCWRNKNQIYYCNKKYGTFRIWNAQKLKYSLNLNIIQTFWLKFLIKIFIKHDHFYDNFI